MALCARLDTGLLQHTFPCCIPQRRPVSLPLLPPTCRPRVAGGRPVRQPAAVGAADGAPPVERHGAVAARRSAPAAGQPGGGTAAGRLRGGFLRAAVPRGWACCGSSGGSSRGRTGVKRRQGAGRRWRQPGRHAGGQRCGAAALGAGQAGGACGCCASAGGRCLRGEAARRQRRCAEQGGGGPAGCWGNGGGRAGRGDAGAAGTLAHDQGQLRHRWSANARLTAVLHSLVMQWVWRPSCWSCTLWSTPRGSAAPCSQPWTRSTARSCTPISKHAARPARCGSRWACRKRSVAAAAELPALHAALNWCRPSLPLLFFNPSSISVGEGGVGPAP